MSGFFRHVVRTMILEVNNSFDRRICHHEYFGVQMPFSRCMSVFFVDYLFYFLLEITYGYNYFYPLIINIVYGVFSKQGSGVVRQDAP